ncbi:MAG: hypothetical protein BGO26_14185 [Actinobacteria bacterium 69-20]|nr:hypothetical protein [Actinomycetota bacterium]OJV29479.1 MAG: hypothetical protein BGO26_14185 [Actinobacteria bacterium 69-20]
MTRFGGVRRGRRRAHGARRRPLLHAVIAAVAVLAAVAAVAGCTGRSADGPSPAADESIGPTPTGGVAGTGTDLIPPDTGGESGGATGTTSATSAPPAPAAGPPQSVLLPWLKGPTPDDGVILGADGTRLWQGPRAGERALLGDGWYRYFGPDGSLVGCTSAGSCVGVGGDGTVSVTAGPGDPREVYRSNGTYLGRYSAAGEKMAAEPDPRTFADALAASGVDVAGLVNAATRTAPFAGGVTGDPHLITAAGQRITTQVIGQFVARGGDPTHVIQLQFDPMSHRTDVSVVSAAAIGTGANTVIVEASGVVSVDGRIQPRGSGFQQTSLAGGVVLGRWPSDADGVSTVVVMWPDGSSVVATVNAALGLTLVANIFPRAGATGLFGSVDAPAGSDLLARGGSATAVPSAILSWRVTAAERLLPAPAGTLPPFPTQTATIDSGAAKVAQQVCDGHGMRNVADVAACAFDVGLTGDTGFVAGHLELSAAAEVSAIPSDFAARWPALEPAAPASAHDLPANGQLAFTLAPAQTQAFHLTIATPGAVGVANRSGCAAGANPPGMDQPALRVFDAAGHAVSDRLPLCGHVETPALRAGTYTLVVANGIGRAAIDVRGNVVLP